MTGNPQPLLSIRDLAVEISTPRGTMRVLRGVMRVLRGVDLDIDAHSIVGLVGESGSGKSTLALAILQIVAANAAIVGGEIVWKGRDLVSLGETELDRMRGREITMIFQDPMNALNPVISIGQQMVDIQWRDGDRSQREKRQRAMMALERVGIGDAALRLGQYAHQFSGGTRQRIAIAMALLPGPDLVIADEPTTALDVTLEAQIARLFRELRSDFTGSMLFVSHNLGLVADLCDRVVVMYAGEVVEEGPVDALFHHPLHPYTRLLLECDPAHAIDRADDDLPTIPGEVPSLLARPAGCSFANRCPAAMGICTDKRPEWHRVGEGRGARCHLLSQQT